ncbi:hypothetical protein [Litorivivens sp.]|uniref:hypothetical protein n=1 Tax=Litorivivens sp. TaxID=2020868 RepID=UPI00356AD573
MAIKGGYNYQPGATGGTVSVPDSARVIQITARGADGATMKIGEGGNVSVYPSFTELPEGSIIGPVDIVFTGTDAFFVSWIE